MEERFYVGVIGKGSVCVCVWILERLLEREVWIKVGG